MKKIKFASVAKKITDPMKQCLDEIPRRSGMYNWLFLFKGEIVNFDCLEDPERFDVIQINMSPADMPIVKEIHDKIKNGSTKLVLNNDYVAERWYGFNKHPYEYWQVQEMGDFWFGTEPYQTSCMSDGAFCIPHPTYMKSMKRLEPDFVKNRVGTFYHWWEGKSYIPGMVAQKLKRTWDKELGDKPVTRMYAYKPDNDNSKRKIKTMIDKFFPTMDFPDYIQHVMTNKVVYEPCHYHTYGRNSVDTAAIGVPTVGSNRVFSMRHCWENLACDPVNVKQIVENIKKVYKGGEWLIDQIANARKKAEYFNYENSEKRFMAALDMAEDNENKNVDGYFQWNEDKEEFEIK